MSYKEALEAAGYKIKDFEMFGSYHGNWAAITDDNKVIVGEYGSCSACDEYEAFIEGQYYSNKLHKETEELLKEFGLQYKPIEDLEEWFAKEKWDSSDTERAAWIRSKI